MFTVPQAEFLGLKVPDKNLKWNEETRHYDFGDICLKTISGNLKRKPHRCNKKRLETKRKAQAENAWVKKNFNCVCYKTGKFEKK